MFNEYQVFRLGGSGQSAVDGDSHIPINLSFPTVIPELIGINRTVYANVGDWLHAKNFTYQWYKNNVEIFGATGNGYTTTYLDSEAYLTCAVTAHNSLGSVTIFTSNRALVGDYSVILLSSTTIVENLPAMTTVGTLSVQDGVLGTPFFYLEDNADGIFVIVDGNVLKTTVSLDFEAISSYDIVVGCMGVTPPTVSKTFTINVLDDSADTPYVTFNPYYGYGHDGVLVFNDVPPGTVVSALTLHNVVGTPVFTVTGRDNPTEGGLLFFEMIGNQLVTKAADFDTVDTIDWRLVEISVTGVTPPVPVIYVTVWIFDHDTGFTDSDVSTNDYFIVGQTMDEVVGHGLNQYNIGDANRLDPRDFIMDGYIEVVRNYVLKDIHTTGTIGAASNSLTVASAAGFTIGDQIIIETGGEPGLGEHNTVGVGGVWPDISYPTEAALLADTSRPPWPWIFAYAEDTGHVFNWGMFGYSVWWDMHDIPGPPGSNRYYIDSKVPRALVTTITNIVGNVLTLNNYSVAATTGANVHIDNYPVILAQQANGLHVVINLPAGNFAVSDGLNEILLPGYPNYGKRGWTLKGAGMDVTTLFIPDGVQCTRTGASMLRAYAYYDFTARDFTIKGNWGLKGYVPQAGASWWNDGIIEGIIGPLNHNSTMHNIKAIDFTWGGMGFQASGFWNWTYNCHTVKTDPQKYYIGWETGAEAQIGGGCVDINVDCEYFENGLEFFRCHRSLMLRPVIRNACLAFNSVSASSIIDATITLEALKLYRPEAHQLPMVTINTNIGTAVQLGTLIENCNMTVEGYGRPDKNQVPIGITTNYYNPDNIIKGGSYTAPDFIALSGDGEYGAVGIASDSPNTQVTNFICTGTVNPAQWQGNIGVQHGSVRDSTAHVIHAPEHFGNVSDPPSTGNTILP